MLVVSGTVSPYDKSLLKLFMYERDFKDGQWEDLDSSPGMWHLFATEEHLSVNDFQTGLFSSSLSEFDEVFWTSALNDTNIIDPLTKFSPYCFRASPQAKKDLIQT
jgi:hypothetical protein